VASGGPAYRYPFLFIMIFVAISLIIYLLRIRLSNELPFLLLTLRFLLFQPTICMFNSKQILKSRWYCCQHFWRNLMRKERNNINRIFSAKFLPLPQTSED